MIQDNTIIEVRNRNNGATGYSIPDQHIDRNWEPYEIKKIPFAELRAFSYMPGGLYALNNLLIIENREALDALNMNVEPEYFYTEEQIEKMLFEGTIDEFADFLDFAPEGAIEVAKTIAVDKEIPDVRKREMLSQKTGLNINNAIMVNHVMEEDSPKETSNEAPKRRVAVEDSESSTPERRATAPKYKVVEKKS